MIDELLKEGRVEDALEALKEKARREPEVLEHRIFLFELFALVGDWERSAKQLEVVHKSEGSALVLAQTYGGALRCEAVRAAVFEGKETPSVFGEPEAWLADLLHALKLEGQGEIAAAMDLRGAALDGALDGAGTIDGQPFAWLADADVRFGPCMEVVIEGAYYWLPFRHVSKITKREPGALRDVIWAPTVLELTNGGRVGALVPARYPGTERAEEGALRLARSTEWDDLGHGLHRGLGQRLWVSDAGEDIAFLDVREVLFGSEADGASAGSDG